MLLGISIEETLQEIGHDGSEIIWPHLTEPSCRRAFHISEIIELFDCKGFSLTPIDCLPRSVPFLASDVEPYNIQFEANLQRINTHLLAPGILIGYGPYGNPHAAAWNGCEVHDPTGTIYELEAFRIGTFWKMAAIKAISMF